MTASGQINPTVITAQVGLGLIGYAIAGILGAGIALVLPLAITFASVIVEGSQTGAAFERSEKTARHRYLLWIDRRGRKRAFKKEERRKRKEAEQAYLESRRGGR